MSNATEARPPDDKIIATFVSSGRSGRRNAMGDILGEGELCANTSGLPVQLGSMNLGGTQGGQQMTESNSTPAASKS